MRRRSEAIIYSPHDLMNFASSEFVCWMDRRALDEQLEPDDDDAAADILQRQGLEHERKYLEQLRAQGKAVVTIDAHSRDAGKLTIKALEAGAEVVYQAYLQGDNFAGIADFLIKVDGASALGDWHYEIWDSKLARDIKPEFIIQLCCYADMLNSIQGHDASRAGIVLGTGEERVIELTAFSYYYRQLKKAFLACMQAFNPKQEPDDIILPDFCRWKTAGKALLEQRDDLSLVANVRRSQIKKLQGANIVTLQQLADADVGILKPNMRAETFDNLRLQAQLQAESRRTLEPVCRVLPASQRRVGFKLLPPPDELDVWFDMEGYTLKNPPLEYLFGATHMQDGQRQFSAWWAHSYEEEKIAFEKFIDWLFQRWDGQSQRRMHVYHYAHYEPTNLKRLMSKYGTREQQIDELLRNEVFVDLFQVVRHALRVGEPGYSIKNLERFYRGKRQEAVATAVDSLVFYERWLETQDQKYLDQIRDYNKVDCDSTMELSVWLRQKQQQSGIAYEPKPPFAHAETMPSADNAGPIPLQTGPDAIPPQINLDGHQAQGSVGAMPCIAPSMKAQCAALAQRMLVQRDGILDPAERRRHELLAYLLQFYEREEKSVWWELYEKATYLQEELFEDAGCLGMLELLRTIPAQGRQKNPRFAYQVDLGQDSKLGLADTWVFAHDINIEAKVEDIDEDAGELTITTRAVDPPLLLGLIPKDMPRPDPPRTAIFETVSQWCDGQQLPAALRDLIDRVPPRLNPPLSLGTALISSDAGPAECRESRFQEQLNRLATRMDETTLCIQGPPGSGKTHSAARIICSLIAAGKKIGITSHSHNAIEHLCKAVDEYATEDGATFRGFKVGRDFNVGSVRAAETKDLQALFAAASFDLVGGTAWALSRPEARGAFDYLFVEEAGQMSLANLVGMSRSTKNIVLVGDQMQLEQPIKSDHPGDSGKSILEYYMNGQSTVPEEQGVFLPVSHRMHPDLCAVVSEQVYNSRLVSAPQAARRHLLLPEPQRLIRRTVGIQHFPLQHAGNTHSSIEEVELIHSLVQELLSCGFIDEKGSELTLTPDHILVVAPYNAQVRLLKSRLPAGVRIGTVDRFQGLQAPVCILSMCSSDANSSPRGLSFLFDKHRLNVALSRAQCLALVVGAERLSSTQCTTVEQMELVNFYCRIVQT